MYRTKEERQLAEGRISVLFRKFAIPGVVGLLFIGMQPMVDGAILGNLIGADALTGVSLFVPLYTFVSAMAVVVGIGCQAVVSMALGNRDYRRAHTALRTAFVALLSVSLLIGIITFIAAEPLARLLGADEKLMPYTVAYARGFCLFFPCLSLAFLCDYLLKAMGRPYFAMCVLAGILVVHTSLAYLVHRMPGMGCGKQRHSFRGVVFVGHLGDAAADSAERKPGESAGRAHLYNGSSEGLSELSAGIAVLLFNWAMMKLWGTAGVAAFTSVNYLLYLGVQLFVGLSDGIIPIFSFNYGAGRFSRVRETLYMGLKTNGVLGLTFFCIVFFGARSIIPLFFDANLTENVDDVLEIAYIGAGFCAFAFLMNGLNILSSSFFTSMGDAATSAIISLLRGLIMTTVGIVLYPVLFGHHGIWLVIPVAELVTLACCFFLVKKRLSLFETSKITA